ncbi:hypothetical protein GDO86_000059 [Hymenochirus boettgeri]|uniref:Polyadenylate-binding protein-interacting protein 2B n=2 Tax=Hymenochirus TaxID=8361 RepID=A0A8T2K9J1_9PIPI|nr:hypothetical protein GDO86_000059 [Hymenochirus boettgeri]
MIARKGAGGSEGSECTLEVRRRRRKCACVRDRGTDCTEWGGNATETAGPWSFVVRDVSILGRTELRCPGLGLSLDSIMMNGSNIGNNSSNTNSNNDQVVNGHDENENNPFAEYMWMENEEDFNRQVEEELQEQEFLDRCFQEMLDEEDQDWFIPSRDLPQGVGQLQQQLNGLTVNENHSTEDILSKSSLNPYAKEFVPGVKY